MSTEIENLSLLINPYLNPEKEQPLFQELIKNYQTAQVALQDFTPEQTQLTESEKLKLTQFDFDQKQAEIYSPNSNRDRSRVTGRIRVALSNPNLKLPADLEHLRQYAVDIHPELQNLHDELKTSKLEEAAARAKADARIVATRQALTYDDKVAENSFRIFCEQKIVDQGLAFEYLEISPKRLPEVRSKQIEHMLNSNPEAEQFPEFIDFLKNLGTPSQRIDKRLLGIGYSPTLEQVTSNSDIFRRFRDYLGYKFTAACFERGLTPQKPDLPNSLLSF